jgi:hypothetical protein
MLDAAGGEGEVCVLLIGGTAWVCTVAVVKETFKPTGVLLDGVLGGGSNGSGEGEKIELLEMGGDAGEDPPTLGNANASTIECQLF